MPLRDCSFRTYELIKVPSPLLPIRITNPQNGSDWLTYGLVDTGASGTSIPDFVARKIGLDVKAGRRRSGFGVKGKMTLYMHKLRVDILKVDANGTTHDDTIAHTIDGHVAVIEDLPYALLGVDDFLSGFYLHVDYPVKTFSIVRPSA